MSLLEIAATPRIGPVLLNEHLPGVPTRIAEAAEKVTRVSELKWSAPSAAAAAAWLLRAGHAASVDDDETDLPAGMARKKDGYVGAFRGQHARYTEVTASQCRSGVDRRRERRAADWFSHALNAMYDLGSFTMVLPFPRMMLISPIDYSVAPQHYGIRTMLTDWSFDPLVAVFFAADKLQAGETGVVLWQRCDYSAGEPDDTYFPPSLVKRLWIQRGLFRHHPCEEEATEIARYLPYVMERYPVSSYPRVEFVVTPEDVTAIAALRFLWLGERTDPLHPIVQWAICAADEPPPVGYVNPGYLQEDAGRKGLPPIPLPNHPLRENLTITADYADSMAAQASAGALQYGQGPLYAFWRSTYTSLNALTVLSRAITSELRSLDERHGPSSSLADAAETGPGVAALTSAARSDARVRLLAASSPGRNADSRWQLLRLDGVPPISFSESEQAATTTRAERRARAVSRLIGASR
ncbi:FRG domain-containing protein [Kitasatospora sp. RG8]|uniref:FRG domain-containing protein n=1 Tax=Kitasatospora sp. RG8 TaxID=2820815 RepID=UPI001ADF4DB0|nr:FRG domain-containing protein [Kitasatospora sp. RG8]MBP0449045.1 FRG domain-containing protein [Kitasatospora sp. RG8]